MKRLAVIGTRNPTGNQKLLARELVELALKHGWSISTGGAEGIDQVAMETCEKQEKIGRLTVYLPWRSFNQGIIPSGCEKVYYCGQKDWIKSLELHPFPEGLSQGAAKLHARNYGIIESADMVAAFPGENPGGTAQGMRIAEYLGKRMYVYHEDRYDLCPLVKKRLAGKKPV